MSFDGKSPWWGREDLFFKQGELYFADRTAQSLAEQFATPTFVYSYARVKNKLESIHAAINKTRLQGRFHLFYAMKANRFAPLLTMIKQSGLAGIDACSPAEVDHAVSCGFNSNDISYTNTMMSDHDIHRLLQHPGLLINCDSISVIKRIGKQCPGREIGIRINPAIGLGYGQNEKLAYSGSDTTKFGIYREQFAEALAVAKQYDLAIKRIHFHTGCGYLNKQLSVWDSILDSCHWFIDQVSESIEAVNVGGGLGVPHVASDEPLNLDQWASLLDKHFGGTTLRVHVEPGDYLVKDAGILLLQVNTVEKKRDRLFIGVNAGFNIALEPAVYKLPFEPVPAIIRHGEWQPATIAGNINEALDIWYKDISLPPIHEDDILVLLNAGGYSSSMASNHCMRGSFKEVLLID